MNKHTWVKGLVALLVVALMILGTACQGTSSTTQSTAAATAAATASTAQTAAADTNGKPGDPPSGGVPGGSGGSSAAVTGTAVLTQDGGTATKDSANLTATTADQSVVKATNGANLTLTGSTFTKSGDTSSEDSSNFYGLNAGVLAEAGSTITMKNCTIKTDSEGSNGAFSTGTGSTVNLDTVTITTSKNSSRGIDVTAGGTLNATNVIISTSGTHCAAIASDRGGGTETVTGGTMTTTGQDSPGIYSTAAISVTGAKITATGSEAAVIEGKNSITLTDVTISGAKKRGVMLYQSYSGDAEVGTSSFKMTGGSLTALVGPLFYITNTDSVVELTGVTLAQSSGTLLDASAGNWGTQGSNGGKVTFTANSQTLSGNITCDSISSITLSLKSSSTLTATIDTENTAGTMALTLDKTSIWNVTGTSYLTALTDEDTTLANIHSNGSTVYYDASNSANSWLGGKTISLTGGGTLTPSAK